MCSRHWGRGGEREVAKDEHERRPKSEYIADTLSAGFTRTETVLTRRPIKSEE